MNEQPDDREAFIAFERVCGEVLWRSPADDPASQSALTHVRYVSDIGSYTSKFGTPPEWFVGCAANHRLRLCQAALRWGRPLPDQRPTPVAPVAGAERSYDVVSGPVDIQAGRKRTAADLHGSDFAIILGVVADNPATLRALASLLGSEPALAVIASIKNHSLATLDRDLIHDFLLDGLSNSQQLVATYRRWSRDVDGSDTEWPIEVYEFCGVFQVRSPETDTHGPFRSLDSAERFIRFNWDDVECVSRHQGG